MNKKLKPAEWLSKACLAVGIDMVAFVPAFLGYRAVWSTPLGDFLVVLVCSLLHIFVFRNETIFLKFTAFALASTANYYLGWLLVISVLRESM